MNVRSASASNRFCVLVLHISQKDERQQDNSDKERLVHQHLSDLLPSLTQEQDKRRTVRRFQHHKANLDNGYTSLSMFANNALLGGGVRVRAWIREQRKINYAFDGKLGHHSLHWSYILTIFPVTLQPVVMLRALSFSAIHLSTVFVVTPRFLHEGPSTSTTSSVPAGLFCPDIVSPRVQIERARD